MTHWKRGLLVGVFSFTSLFGCEGEIGEFLGFDNHEPPPVRKPPRQPPRVVKRKKVESTPPPEIELSTPSPTPNKLEELPTDSVMARALAYFARELREEPRELKIQEFLANTREEDLEIIRRALLTGDGERCRVAISLLVGYYTSKGQLDKVDDAYQRFFNRCDPRAQDPRDWLVHSRSLLLANLPRRALTQVNEAEKRAPNLPKGVDMVSFQAEILEVRARCYEGLFRSAISNFEENAVVRNYWLQANQNWVAYRGLFEDAVNESNEAAGRVELAKEHLSWLQDQQL